MKVVNLVQKMLHCITLLNMSNHIKMEDYAGAYRSRLSDVDVLLTAQNRRSVAAAHLGGISVECRIKALLIGYHKLAEWNQPSRRLRDPKTGQPIPCPEHGLISGLRLMNDMYKKGDATLICVQQ